MKYIVEVKYTNPAHEHVSLRRRVDTISRVVEARSEEEAINRVANQQRALGFMIKEAKVVQPEQLNEFVPAVALGFEALAASGAATSAAAIARQAILRARSRTVPPVPGVPAPVRPPIPGVPAPAPARIGSIGRMSPAALAVLAGVSSTIRNRTPTRTRQPNSNSNQQRRIPSLPSVSLPSLPRNTAGTGRFVVGGKTFQDSPVEITTGAFNTPTGTELGYRSMNSIYEAAEGRYDKLESSVRTKNAKKNKPPSKKSTSAKPEPQTTQLNRININPTLNTSTNNSQSSLVTMNEYMSEYNLTIDSDFLFSNLELMNTELDILTQKQYQNSMIFLNQLRGFLDRFGMTIPAMDTKEFQQSSNEIVYALGNTDFYLYIVYDTSGSTGYIDGYAQIVNHNDLNDLLNLNLDDEIENDGIYQNTMQAINRYAKRDDDSGNSDEY